MSASTNFTPLWSPLDKRRAGALLHVSSLPGPYGIGQFSAHGRECMDALAAAGISLWQVCPLGPTGYGDSPYQTFSAFALNPYFIDLDALVSAGLIEGSSLDPLRKLSAGCVDFGALYIHLWPILRRAASAFLRSPKKYEHWGSWADFCEREKDWLDPYCLFMALKESHKGAPWWTWPAAQRNWKSASAAGFSDAIKHHADQHRALQYIAFGQWKTLREYATDAGVTIFGDIAIFVAKDSADLWSHPELFDMDPKTGLPASQAGVPPDYYSEDGQLWGNPLYDWPAHAKDGYRWWMRRIGHNLELFGAVRLDHFLGFEGYWRVGIDQTTARQGTRMKGPGLAFFQAVKKHFPDALLIAEDLGDITPQASALMDKTGLARMLVLQFAFGSGAKNAYLPHNALRNRVIYPGTHDNDTTAGWYASVDGNTQDRMRRYLQVSGVEVAWDFIRAAYKSVAAWAVIPMQDFFSLPSAARLNFPGTSQGNWQWRLTPGQLGEFRKSADYLKELGGLYGRCD